MSDLVKPAEEGPAKPILGTKDGVFVKTARLTINLLTHVLICFTAFVCVVYVCSSKVMTLYHWHIILCVMGVSLISLLSMLHMFLIQCCHIIQSYL